MSWLKIDDGFAENRKVAALSHQAFRLHVAAMCYCARADTGGNVPAQAVRIIAATADVKSHGRHVAELERAELWRPTGDGHEINDWKLYNGTVQERVSAFLEKHPDAPANEVYRTVGGDRNQVLAEVKRQKRGGMDEPKTDQPGRYGHIPAPGMGSGMENGIDPSQPHKSTTSPTSTTDPARDPAGTAPAPLRGTETDRVASNIGRELLLTRLLAAAGGGEPARRKLDRTLHGHTITDAGIVAAIDAATGPGIRDPLAAAISTLVKHRRSAA